MIKMYSILPSLACLFCCAKSWTSKNITVCCSSSIALVSGPHLNIFHTFYHIGSSVQCCCILHFSSISFCYLSYTRECTSFTSFALGSLFHAFNLFSYRFSGGGHSHSHDHEGHNHAHEHAHAHSLEDLSVGLSILCEYIPDMYGPTAFFISFMFYVFRPLLDTFCNMWIPLSWLIFSLYFLTELLQTVSFNLKY